MKLVYTIALTVLASLVPTPAFAGGGLSKAELEEQFTSAMTIVHDLRSQLDQTQADLDRTTDELAQAKEDLAKERARADEATRKLAAIAATEAAKPAPPEVDPDIALAQSFGLDLGHMSAGQKIWFAVYKRHRSECYGQYVWAGLSPLGKQACSEAEDQLRLQLLSIPVK